MIAFILGLLLALASGSVEQGWKPQDHEATGGHAILVSWSWPCPVYVGTDDWCWLIIEADQIEIGPYIGGQS